MLFGVLCLALFAGEIAGICRYSEVPAHLQLMVDLYNQFVRYFVAFDYDFGNGVSLVSGEATIRVFKSIQILSHSEISQKKRKGILELMCPLGFQIRLKRSGVQGLDMKDCLMELEYAVDNSSGEITTRPTSAWIHSCGFINYLNTTKPQHPEQILPLLSQAILSELAAHFTFQGYPLQVGFQDLVGAYKWILYDGIMDGARILVENRN